jgi:hypothetical protein
VTVVSDRPAGCLQVTEEWLRHYGVPYDDLRVGPDWKVRLLESAARPGILVDDNPGLARLASAGPGHTVVLVRRPWTPAAVPGALVVSDPRDLLRMMQGGDRV